MADGLLKPLLALKVGTSEFLASWAGGGLYGYASVVNVDMGTSFGYDAIAIADHVANNATGSAMHYEPGDINPNFTNSAFDTSAIVNNAGATTIDFTAGGSTQRVSHGTGTERHDDGSSSS